MKKGDRIKRTSDNRIFVVHEMRYKNPVVITAYSVDDGDSKLYWLATQQVEKCSK